MKILALLFCLFFVANNPAQARPPVDSIEVQSADELDPFDPNIESKLDYLDSIYGNEDDFALMENSSRPLLETESCYQIGCKIWIRVSKSEQQLYLYIDGALQNTWPVSTGINGRNTPNFETHPNGRIYDKYSSTKYPGGDYNGYGNMPFVVFIERGFAIHGTPKSNWAKLGKKASHGCVRVHPDNAFKINRLVRTYGIQNVWISVQD